MFSSSILALLAHAPHCTAWDAEFPGFKHLEKFSIENMVVNSASMHFSDPDARMPLQLAMDFCALDPGCNAFANNQGFISAIYSESAEYDTYFAVDPKVVKAVPMCSVVNGSCGSPDHQWLHCANSSPSVIAEFQLPPALIKESCRSNPACIGFRVSNDGSSGSLYSAGSVNAIEAYWTIPPAPKVTSVLATAPGGSYQGSVTKLGQTVTTQVNVVDGSTMDLKISGLFTIDCAGEDYTISDADIIVDGVKTAGDCVHDGLDANHVTLVGITLGGPPDRARTDISIYHLMMSLKRRGCLHLTLSQLSRSRSRRSLSHTPHRENASTRILRHP